MITIGIAMFMLQKVFMPIFSPVFYLFTLFLLSAMAHLRYHSDAFEMLQQKKVAANEELDIWSSIWGYGLLMASLGLDGMTGPAQERLYEVM